jgi:hypothetical protein
VTALTIVQSAAAQVGLTVPTSVFGNTEQQVIQLRSLLNEEGRSSARAGQWPRLTKQHTFTTTATAVQADGFPTPNDLDRFCNDSMWNRSTSRKVYGPLSEQEYQREQAFPIFNTVNPAFLQRGADFIAQPAAQAGNTWAYSYVSIYWALATDGTTEKAEMTADTDTALLPEYILTLGVVWRFLKANKFPFEAEKQTYEGQLQQEIARQGGAPKLNLTYGLNRFSPYPFNILDGNWPGN